MQQDSDGINIMEENAFERFKIAGGLKLSSFTESALFQCNSFTLLAVSSSNADILLVFHSIKKCRKKLIPWRLNSCPVAMTFKGYSGKNLLVAGSDGCVVDIPLNTLYEDICYDLEYDATVFTPESNRGKPTAIVWWETSHHSSIAILGTELGELCFLDLKTGREVGGTYIPGMIHQLQLCPDHKKDSYILLITGPDQCMWHLLLQKESTKYTFPLDLLCENTVNRASQIKEENIPSRFRDFKEMSVNKFFSIKQRMTEAKIARKKKPVSVSRGVGTDDIGSSLEAETGTVTTTITEDDTTTIQDQQDYLSKPQIYQLMGHEVYACRQHCIKNCYQIAGYSKEKTCLMVCSFANGSTSISSKFYLDNVYIEYLIQSDVIFLSSNQGKTLSVVSNYFAELVPQATERMRQDYLLQEITLARDEAILKLYESTAFEDFLCKSDMDRDYVNNKRGFLPNACIVVTTKNIYIVQTRDFVGSLLIDKILRFGNSAYVKKFGKTFKLDSSYFQFAADFEMRRNHIAEAIDLYKYSGVSNVKICLKLSSSGAIAEFLRCWKFFINSRFIVDLSDEEKCIICSLGVIAYLYLLVCPAVVSGFTNREAVFNELLKFLSQNKHYDKILVLTLSAYCWRWDVLQYLSSCRGLNLEKLHLLFNGMQSASLSSSLYNKKYFKNILSKSNHEGYAACMVNMPMRSVILLRPSLTRKVITFITLKINAMSKAMLKKYALLFDPSNIMIRPFLWSSFAGRHHQVAFDFHHETREPVFIENIIDIFLNILVKINELNGWKYNPDLLSITLPESTCNPESEQSVKKEKILSCGYNYSAIIYNDSLLMSGSRHSSVLGYGCSQSISAKYLTFDNCIAQQIQSTIKTCSGEHLTDDLQDDVVSQERDKTVVMRTVDYFNCFKIISLSCGHQHVIAITDNGIYGWGENSYGQLGIGTRNDILRPFFIKNLGTLKVVNITCGQYHTLAVTGDGRLYAWGWGLHGQLGDGSVNDCLKPQMVSALKALKIVNASAGYAHSIALDVEGAVYAWGCGVYGQIGIGDKNKAPLPVRVNLPSPAYSIATGYFHNLVATEDNNIYSWGEHASCLKTKTHLRKKVRRLCMEGDEPEQPASELDKATTTSQAPKECADETTPEFPKLDSDYHLLPREVFHYSERVKQMSTGSMHSMILTDDGNVFTWGRNSNGQIGNGSRIEQAVPYQIKPDLIFEDIAAGSDFSLAIEEGGQLWGWGSNLCSQLGIKLNRDHENSHPFVLKTAKRMVKLPKTHQTNVLSPVEVASFTVNKNKMYAISRKMDESLMKSLNHIHAPGEDSWNEPDSHLYGPKTLHNSLVFLYPHYSFKNIEEILLSCNGHQALAALYCKDKQYKKAMHNQLLSISEYAKCRETILSINDHSSILEAKEESKYSQEVVQEWIVKESSHVLDHYLKLQTEESEAGLKGVLTEGIASWLEFSLPTVQLERLLLNHIPSAMYPLAMVLFGKDSIDKALTNCDHSVVDGLKCGLKQETLQSIRSADAICAEKTISEENTAGDIHSRKFSSNLSREFCFRICNSVIGQMERLKGKETTSTAEIVKLAEEIPHVDTDASHVVDLSNEFDRRPSQSQSDEMRSDKNTNNEDSDRSTWVFTCGHAFGCKEFKEDILPRLEQTVTSVPDQLGKAARVILDQFHGENVLMACPNCALAHLSIQLSKHVKKEEQLKRVL